MVYNLFFNKTIIGAIIILANRLLTLAGAIRCYLELCAPKK